MFKAVLYSTVTFLLISLNVVADEGDVERLAVPEYQDAPPTEMTGDMPEDMDTPPTEMMGEQNEPQVSQEMVSEDSPNPGMQEMTESMHNETATEDNSNASNNEDGTAQAPEQNQEEQPIMQKEAPEQGNAQAPETISAEESEAKHAEEVELREVGAGDDEDTQ